MPLPTDQIQIDAENNPAGEKYNMPSRIAIIGIVVEEVRSIDKINNILSSCRESIIGRLGIPYEKRGINVISIVVDAPTDAINALTGKLASLPGVSAKAVFSRTEFVDEA